MGNSGRFMSQSVSSTSKPPLFSVLRIQHVKSMLLCFCPFNLCAVLSIIGISFTSTRHIFQRLGRFCVPNALSTFAPSVFPVFMERPIKSVVRGKLVTMLAVGFATILGRWICAALPVHRRGHKFKVNRIAATSVSAQVIDFHQALTSSGDWLDQPCVGKSGRYNPTGLPLEIAIPIVVLPGSPNPARYAIKHNGEINADFREEAGELFEWEMTYGKVFGSHCEMILSSMVRAVQSVHSGLAARLILAQEVA